MGMTMTQKIMAHYCGKESLAVGQFINCDLTLVLGNDITTPVAIKEFDKSGANELFDKSKVVIVPDHFAPNKDIQAAEQCLYIRQFAIDKGVENYFEVGEMGIEHVLLPEKGLVISGDMMIGADSHTCTYGALGAFSTGVGSTDMAAAMASGKCWFRVPSALKFNITGEFTGDVSGKDLILHIIGMLGVDGARYKSMEFVGEGIKNLTMDDRFTIANMAIEAGAKNGIFQVDELTLEYVADHSTREPMVFAADEDAEYDEVYDIDLSTIPLTVACPHLPDNTKLAKDLKHIKIDQSVIGSCTNGRISDFKVAADILKGKHVKKGVRVIILPGTQKVYLEAMELGYMKAFVEAGCVVSTPTCGPCLGGHMGVLAAGERAIATTNRNFVGRMGHVKSEIYLASPAVAAASAITGYITRPQDLD